MKSFSDNQLILKLSEVNTEKEPEDIIFKNVFIDSKSYEPIEEKSFFYNELVNFSVYSNSKKIGVIDNINTELPQPVFEVLIKSNKVMIPIHEDLIDKIDKKNKIIHIDIPDGLIEII